MNVRTTIPGNLMQKSRASYKNSVQKYAIQHHQREPLQAQPEQLQQALQGAGS